MNPHVSSAKTYFATFSGLIVLTLTTTGIAFVDLGRGNTIVAITIAVAKAMLVVLFLMHVRHSYHLTRVFAAAGVLWFSILLALTLGDVMTRGWIPAPPGW